MKCLNCGKEFPPRQPNHIFCSLSCKKKYNQINSPVQIDQSQNIFNPNLPVPSEISPISSGKPAKWARANALGSHNKPFESKIRKHIAYYNSEPQQKIKLFSKMLPKNLRASFIYGASKYIHRIPTYHYREPTPRLCKRCGTRFYTNKRLKICPDCLR